MFENRFEYRNFVERPGLTSFAVTSCQTNLQILARKDLSKAAIRSVLEHRGYIEAFGRQYPEFFTTLKPYAYTGPAPKIIRDMIEASSKAHVGPMAAVAGAVSQYVGRDLFSLSDEVIIENGGDLFIRVTGPLTIGLYAGKSPLSMKVGLSLNRPNQPFSVCTSSGTVGHSLSFGSADAVCIVSDSAPLADAAATSVANRVKSVSHIDEAIAYGKTIEGVQGIVIVVGSKMGLWGDVTLISLAKKA